MSVVILPAVLSLLTLRYALPSRLAGASGGLTGLIAGLADRHPLFVGILLFLGFSEAARHWGNRWRSGSFDWKPRAFDLRRLAIGLAAVVVLVFVSRSSLVGMYRVVGPSMLPTLEIGDRLVVNRLAYGLRLPLAKGYLGRKPPKRGDLVVFSGQAAGGHDEPRTMVKRVVGLPGDLISFRDGFLFINDWQVPSCDAGPYTQVDGRLTVRGRLTLEYLDDRPYLTVHKPLERPFSGYMVKPNEVFVIGDDRGLSSDSRAWDEGRGAGVPVDALEGRVSRVLFGARPDGRLDFSRVLTPALDLKVRIPGIDTHVTDERIAKCLSKVPASTSPPPGLAARTATSH
ncbi:MAG TPA: signal peptidase I [Polyangia bacterium]|nr:signal peptidase I [Polyangia bacterium]